MVEWVDPESPEAQGSARNMVAVGANTIGGRGFNADVWVHEQYAYVGSWGFSDTASGSKQRFCPAPDKSGVAVLDTRDPAKPRVVSKLQNPPGTSVEDVVVYTARSRPRHRGRGDPGLRRPARTRASSAACRCST